MAIETQELAAIKSGISVAMSGSAGQFRQAATVGAASMTKIVKDISNIFAAQRRDLADLSNSINEVVHELEQTNSKFDNLERVFEESLSIQTAMRGDMKTMAISMKNMTDGIYQLDRNMQSVISTGPNSLLSGLTAGLTSGFGGVTGKLGELLLKVGVPLAAGAAAGGAIGYTMGGGGGGGDVPGIKTSGSMAQNQQEAYKAARAEGLSDQAARIAVANVSGENLKNPGGVYSDPSRRNPNQKAHGIVAWDDERSARIKQVFGKYPQEMSVADQTKAYIWEMKTHYKQAYNDLINENLSEQQRLASVVENFEKPKDVGGAVANRMRFLKGLKVSESPSANVNNETSKISETTNQSASDATPVSKNPVTPMSSGGNTPSTETKNTNQKQESGPAKSADASKVKLIERYGPGRPERPDDSILNIAKKAAAGAGMESITATSGKGNYISAAGRAKGQKTTMHSTGLAVDLTGFTSDEQKLEFIKQAKEAGAKGVGIYDNGSVHIDLGRERSWNWGFKDKAAFDAAVKTPSSNQGDVAPKIGPEAPQATEATRVSATPVSSTGTETASPVTPIAAAVEQATPVSQEAVTPAVTAPISSADTSAMMGMMGGEMLPGGLGGILEMIGPMIESLLGSLAPTEAYAQETTQTQNAEMLQSLSKSA